MPSSTSVFLNVHDIARSLSFYKALGFKVTRAFKGKDRSVHYADLELDGAELGLGAISSNDDAEFRAWVGTPLGAGVVVYFTVPEVDKLFAKAKKAGAVIEHPPEDRSYGRVVTINDPDGYVLVFIREPVRARRAKPKPKARETANRKSSAAKRRR